MSDIQLLRNKALAQTLVSGMFTHANSKPVTAAQVGRISALNAASSQLQGPSGNDDDTGTYEWYIKPSGGLFKATLPLTVGIGALVYYFMNY